ADNFTALVIANGGGDYLGRSCGASVYDHRKRSIEYNLLRIGVEGLRLFSALADYFCQGSRTDEQVGQRGAFLYVTVCGPAQVEQYLLRALRSHFGQQRLHLGSLALGQRRDLYVPNSRLFNP